jgi:hypothetical protein
MEVGGIKGSMESIKQAEKDTKDILQLGLDLKKVESGKNPNTDGTEDKTQSVTGKNAVQSPLKEDGKGNVLDLIG